MSTEDQHYELLRHIARQPNAGQRGLAALLGVSVGKVNYCLKAVVDLGWVKAQNFRRSDNKWAYAYLLTPSGALAKLQLTRDFLARKEREFEQLQVDISALRLELQRKPSPATLPPSPSLAAQPQPEADADKAADVLVPHRRNPGFDRPARRHSGAGQCP